MGILRQPWGMSWVGDAAWSAWESCTAISPLELTCHRLMMMHGEVTCGSAACVSMVIIGCGRALFFSAIQLTALQTLLLPFHGNSFSPEHPHGSPKTTSHIRAVCIGRGRLWHEVHLLNDRIGPFCNGHGRAAAGMQVRCGVRGGRPSAARALPSSAAAKQLERLAVQQHL